MAPRIASEVAHTAALRRTVREPTIPDYPRSRGLVEWWDSLIFMTADARVRSRWVTFEPSSASSLFNPTDKVPLHWNRTSALTNTPTSRRNMAFITKE
jgi:hypothetical protein